MKANKTFIDEYILWQGPALLFYNEFVQTLIHITTFLLYKKGCYYFGGSTILCQRKTLDPAKVFFVRAIICVTINRDVLEYFESFFYCTTFTFPFFLLILNSCPFVIHYQKLFLTCNFFLSFFLESHRHKIRRQDPAKTSKRLITTLVTSLA